MAPTVQPIIYIAQYSLPFHKTPPPPPTPLIRLTLHLLERLEIWLTTLHARMHGDIQQHKHQRAMEVARTNAELDYARRWLEFRRNEAMQMAHIRGTVEHARFEAREARAVRRAEEWIEGEGLAIRVGRSVVEDSNMEMLQTG
ncbi:hypothetical protein TI39_contig4331g00003 [Zymoseptoria brevis]|uniref:Uncharacterized protein n=1 Tax=Zymoseptoria brevis TaxID=1047168 RepID=A0A0F4G7J3_9PEZI|nr:hypothetical protein TI39_contig4331g00003 [Zymoseptoria brevis]